METLKFNIKEVAHQSKSAVTSKKLHKIYIDVATTYTQIITQLLASKFILEQSKTYIVIYIGFFCLSL